MWETIRQTIIDNKAPIIVLLSEFSCLFYLLFIIGLPSYYTKKIIEYIKKHY